MGEASSVQSAYRGEVKRSRRIVRVARRILYIG
jgi:hypothetical protein